MLNTNPFAILEQANGHVVVFIHNPHYANWIIAMLLMRCGP